MFVYENSASKCIAVKDINFNGKIGTHLGTQLITYSTMFYSLVNLLQETLYGRHVNYFQFN